MALSRNLTPTQQRLVVVAVVVQAVIAALTLRDLGRRGPEQVRGPKWLWRILGTANTSGSAAYWLFGRRPPLPEPALRLALRRPRLSRRGS